jgi:hypothetical protein
VIHHVHRMAVPANGRGVCADGAGGPGAAAGVPVVPGAGGVLVWLLGLHPLAAAGADDLHSAGQSGAAAAGWRARCCRRSRWPGGWMWPTQSAVIGRVATPRSRSSISARPCSTSSPAATAPRQMGQKAIEPRTVGFPSATDSAPGNRAGKGSTRRWPEWARGTGQSAAPGACDRAVPVLESGLTSLTAGAIKAHRRVRGITNLVPGGTAMYVRDRSSVPASTAARPAAPAVTAPATSISPSGTPQGQYWQEIQADIPQANATELDARAAD